MLYVIYFLSLSLSLSLYFFFSVPVSYFSHSHRSVQKIHMLVPIVFVRFSLFLCSNNTPIRTHTHTHIHQTAGYETPTYLTELYVKGNSNSFVWILDATLPTMTISSSSIALDSHTNDETVSLTFTSSESTNDFLVSDIVASGGELSDFSGSGTTYTAKFTHTGSEGDKSVKVMAGAFTDAAGGGNVESAVFSWVHDATSPTMTISSSDGDSGFLYVINIRASKLAPFCRSKSS